MLSGSSKSWTMYGCCEVDLSGLANIKGRKKERKKERKKGLWNKPTLHPISRYPTNATLALTLTKLTSRPSKISHSFSATFLITGLMEAGNQTIQQRE